MNILGVGNVRASLHLLFDVCVVIDRRSHGICGALAIEYDSNLGNISLRNRWQLVLATDLLERLAAGLWEVEPDDKKHDCQYDD